MVPSTGAHHQLSYSYQMLWNVIVPLVAKLKLGGGDEIQKMLSHDKFNCNRSGQTKLNVLMSCNLEKYKNNGKESKRQRGEEGEKERKRAKGDA